MWVVVEPARRHSLELIINFLILWNLCWCWYWLDHTCLTWILKGVGEGQPGREVFIGHWWLIEPDKVKIPRAVLRLLAVSQSRSLYRTSTRICPLFVGSNPKIQGHTSGDTQGKSGVLGYPCELNPCSPCWGTVSLIMIRTTPRQLVAYPWGLMLAGLDFRMGISSPLGLGLS
jgi:hypothetical protein